MTLLDRLERLIEAATAPSDILAPYGQLDPAKVEKLAEPLRNALATLEGYEMLAGQALRQLRHIAPELDVDIAPMADDQEQFATLYAGLLFNPTYALAPGLTWNTVLIACKPDREHVAALAGGASLYVSLLTFGNPMPAIIVQVGKHSVSAAYNVSVSED